MQVVNDCGNHGYTVDDDDNVWYWKMTDDTIEFRYNAGYPVNHPINEVESVPQSIKTATQNRMMN